jgi:large subunit ribosomal protein L25
MRQQELEVRRRSETGKGIARKLRAQGHIPAVCYRKGLDPILLSLEQRELERILQTAGGQNILIQLKIEGEAPSENPETVIVKEVQKDPLNRMLHADFMGVLMDQVITVEVAVRLVGEPTEALREGGMVQQLRRVVELECLPGDIPEYIDAEIADLTMGESIHVEELKVPEGSRILTDAKEPVVVISAPVEEEEEKPEEEEPGEEVAEGEEEDKEKDKERDKEKEEESSG